MNFILTGRDHLSRVLNGAGDASDRLGRRLLAMSVQGDAAMRRLGNSTTTRLAGMTRDADAGSKALDAVKKSALSLAPAAIPAAASLLPIAAGAGAVAVALGAMGAAMGPQIAKLSEAAEAEKRYQDAVEKSGAHSEAAITAQREYAQSMAKLPPETRKAAAAVGVLKDDYQAWSDSLAGDTMAPFSKGVALVNALLPKTTGLVKGASGQTDRFLTIIGGAMASPGFDGLNRRFTDFTTNTLSRMNDKVVSVLGRLNNGGGAQAGGTVREFMDWARVQGPTVGNILQNVGTALMNVLRAGSEVGVGMLQAIDVLANIVAAVPPSAIALFLQLAVAMRLVKLAAAGMGAASAAAAAFGTQLAAMRTGAAGTTGVVGRLTGAFAGLSRAAKLNVAALGVGLLVLAVTKLSNIGKSAPPDVDRLSTSLGNLGRTGKASGYVAAQFGKDFGKLNDLIGKVTNPSTVESINNWGADITGGFLDGGDASEEFAKKTDAADDALSKLVSNGNAKLAKAALDHMMKGLSPENAKKFRESLDGYDKKLADLALEQKITADAMGIFGSKAQDVQAKLDGQKMAAEGLRQSIVALNDVNRSAYDGQIAFEGAIDNLTKSFKENGATLDISTDAGRKNGTAMSQVAKAHDEMVTSGLAAGDSLGSMTRKSDKLRGSMMRLATQAFDGNKQKAKEYVNTLLGAPGEIKTLVKLERKQAVAGLESVQAAIKKTPGAKSVKVATLNGAAIRALEAVGLKTRTLKDGRTQVYTKNGQALGAIGSVSRAIASLRNRTVTITVFRKTTIATIHTYQKKYLSGRSQHDITGKTGGLYTGGDFAHRGKGYAGGGLVEGPGTGTSDSVFAPWLSAKEFVVNARQTARNLPLLRAINDGKIGMGTLGTGGAGAAVAQGLAGGIDASHGLVAKAARAMAAVVITGMKDELQIASPSKRTKALANDVGKGLISGMTGSRDKIKATSKDLAKDIWSAFSGSKDNRLVSYVNRHTKTLLSLASKRDALTATIKRAKDFAESTRVGAKKSASLGGMFEGDEQVSASGINSKLQQRLARMKTFSSYIKTLAKRGLNKTMLREILEMGPEEGYAYASALAGSSSKLLKEINSTQFKINDQAESLGRSGADALYDSGKNAGRGFLKGLASQQSAIEKQMLKIAKGMDKAIRKALGIRSPSTVMAQVGRHSTEGLAHGLTDRMPLLNTALRAVGGKIGGIYPVFGRPALANGVGGQVVQIQIDVHGAMDPVAVGKELQRVLVKLKRTQGVNVNLGVA
ncbi:hypothetical protein OG302_22280 [Streptomyces sp. NBC_01283]|nr:hypothetical protein OG302_22280 [Streptomyces sp. NBC_01283]